MRSRRLSRGWSQAELAERAGLKLPTYVVFERTGRISLLRLLKVLEVLDLLDDFDRVGRERDLSGLTLDDLEQPQRKRGRRKP
jgi:HTH-type transcriptional regulator/antitoxin HipB